MSAIDTINNDQFLKGAYDSWTGALWDQGKGVDGGGQQKFLDQFSSLKNSFTNQFQTLVGRAPTGDELNSFMSDFVKPHITNLTSNGDAYNQNPDSYVQSFIGNNFQQAAKDTATQKLTQQQGQANDLANLFRTQGNAAINDTENSLLDYQSRLFEKLRPNLMTSLQAQGLLNTGGMNSAVAGAQADLANSVTPWLAQAKLNNEQQANQISFSGASAPFNYAQANTLNQVPYMQGQAQSAMNQNYNTFLTNLNAQNQMALLNRQAQIQQGLQPTMLSTMGQSFANSFGSGAGQAGTSWFNANSFSGGGGKGGAATLLA